MSQLFDSCMKYLKDQVFNQGKNFQGNNTSFGVKTIEGDVLVDTIIKDCNSKISNAMMNEIAKIEEKIPEFLAKQDDFLKKTTEIKDQIINLLYLSLTGVVDLLEQRKHTSQQDPNLWNVHIKEVILDSAVKFFQKMPQEALALENFFQDIQNIQNIQDVQDKLYELKLIMRGFQVKMILPTTMNNREKNFIGSSRLSSTLLESASSVKTIEKDSSIVRRPLPEQPGRERRMVYGYNLWEDVKGKNLEKKKAQNVTTKARKLNKPKP